VGLSGTQQTMYYAAVTDEMRVGSGGGNADEGELIQVVEVPVDHCLKNLLQCDTMERSVGLLFSLLWFQQFKAPLS